MLPKTVYTLCSVPALIFTFSCIGMWCLCHCIQFIQKDLWFLCCKLQKSFFFSVNLHWKIETGFWKCLYISYINQTVAEMSLHPDWGPPGPDLERYTPHSWQCINTGLLQDTGRMQLIFCCYFATFMWSSLRRGFCRANPPQIQTEMRKIFQNKQIWASVLPKVVKLMIHSYLFSLFYHSYLNYCSIKSAATPRCSLIFPCVIYWFKVIRIHVTVQNRWFTSGLRCRMRKEWREKQKLLLFYF